MLSPMLQATLSRQLVNPPSFTTTFTINFSTFHNRFLNGTGSLSSYDQSNIQLQFLPQDFNIYLSYCCLDPGGNIEVEETTANTSYNLLHLISGCRFWDDTNNTWSSEGCTVCIGMIASINTVDSLLAVKFNTKRQAYFNDSLTMIVWLLEGGQLVCDSKAYR